MPLYDPVSPLDALLDAALPIVVIAVFAVISAVGVAFVVVTAKRKTFYPANNVPRKKPGESAPAENTQPDAPGSADGAKTDP